MFLHAATAEEGHVIMLKRALRYLRRNLPTAIYLKTYLYDCMVYKMVCSLNKMSFMGNSMVCTVNSMVCRGNSMICK